MMFVFCMILRKCISVFSLICLVVSSNFESESVKGRSKARSSSAVSKRYIWISGFVISACMLGGLLYFYCCNPSDIVNVMPDDLSNQITDPVVKVPDITDHVVNKKYSVIYSLIDVIFISAFVYMLCILLMQCVRGAW